MSFINTVIYICKFYIAFIFYHLYWIFPVKKNSFYFDSFYGRNFGCNPRYIYNYLLEKGIINDKSIVYVSTIDNKIHDSSLKNIKYINYLSFQYYKSIMTSKFIIVNTDIVGYLPIRKKQVLINTWHGGGAYKKTGLDVKNTFVERLVCAHHVKQTSYFLSSSALFTKAVSTGQIIPASKIVSCGMPRNDGLVNKTYDHNKLLIKMNIPKDSFIVLYAPTYRKEEESLEMGLDFNLIIKTFQDKYHKNVVLLYRDHYYFNNAKEIPNVINMSSYKDMQELLFVSDVLITDYSSSIWDFSLMLKPCFLYCPDMQYYLEHNGVYSPMSNWPGLISQSNEELLDNINSFNEEAYVKKIKDSFDYYTSYDKGNACEFVSKLIKKNI